MPRPMPDSKREAERDRLKVVITWYAFHTLTMRFVCGSGVVAWRLSSRVVQWSRSSWKAIAT